MGRLAEAAAVASIGGLYVAAGAIGALAPAGTPLPVVAGLATVVLVAPGALVGRAIVKRRGGGRLAAFAIAMLGWSLALVAVAAAAPGREERFAWPVHTGVAYVIGAPAVSTTGARTPTPTTETPPPTPRKPARGIARLDLRLDDPSAPPTLSAPIELRYAAAWPTLDGIEVGLADQPIACAGSHDGASAIVTCHLPPSLDGHFFAGTEMASRCTISPLASAPPDGTAETFVTVRPFEVKAGARIEGQMRIARVLSKTRRLVGEGTFETTLCDGRYEGPNRSPKEEPLTTYAIGWRAPAPNPGNLAGRIGDSAFAPVGAIANMLTLPDGRTVLHRLLFSTAPLECGAAIPRDLYLGAQPYAELAAPHPPVPVIVGAGPVREDNLTGVVEVTRIADVVEGTLTAWMSNRANVRTTEVSGRFRARVCSIKR